MRIATHKDIEVKKNLVVLGPYVIKLNWWDKFKIKFYLRKWNHFNYGTCIYKYYKNKL